MFSIVPVYLKVLTISTLAQDALFWLLKFVYNILKNGCIFFSYLCHCHSIVPAILDGTFFGNYYYSCSGKNSYTIR